MMDDQTTVADLRELVRKFVADRDWSQFHAPKNLTMALSIEASELMEHFQWLTVEASREIGQDREKLQAVGDELADVVCYALALANELNIDLSDSICRKMVKNEQKYPADHFQGRYE
jgi:dCTP diphosphatase